MFERTTTLWRRLIGRAQPVAGETPEEHDRRVWVRYPSELLTRYSLMGNGHEPHFSARVRDVSLGGIKLNTTSSLEPGTLLTITLPGDGKSSLAVLACVVHSRQVSASEWIVGCSFSAELEEWQLRAFGARHPQPAENDGRQVARFPCGFKAFCQVAGEPENPTFEADVLNVSLNGMALNATQELLTGTLLNAELHGSRGATLLTILACVVHVTTQQDGQRITGCNFIRELTDQDLRLLL